MPGDQILDQNHQDIRDLQGRVVHVVLRQSDEPFRPLFHPHGGVIARFDQDVGINRQTLQQIVDTVIQWGERQKLYPLGGADRVLYFLPREYISDFFNTIEIDGLQATDPAIQGRLGVLLKRPGVFNPQDPCWKEAGGDFDGDFAVVFPQLDAHPLRPVIPRRENFVDDPPYQSEARKQTIRDAVVELADVPVEIRGVATLICTKLAERHLLAPETAALGAAVIQGAFDVRKHAVRLGELLDAYSRLQSESSRLSPISPLTERLRPLKNAKGHREQKQAWKELAEWGASVGAAPSATEQAMIARINLLNELFVRLGIFLDNPELPTLLKKAARAEVAQQPDGESQRGRVEALRNDYLARRRKARYHVAEDLDTLTSDDEKCSIQVAFRSRYQAGEFSAAALLGYGVQWLAAEIVCADEVERIAATIPSEGETYLMGHGWHSGIYAVIDIQPAQSTRRVAV